MRVEIIGKCSLKYIMLLRLYCGMLAFIALCAAITLKIGGFDMMGYAAAVLCALMLCATLTVPLRFGRICYMRSGGCLRIEKGWLMRRTLIINRSDIRSSEVKDGPLQRRLGLCTVRLVTGGGNVSLRGVTVRDGRLLHRMLGGGEAVSY